MIEYIGKQQAQEEGDRTRASEDRDNVHPPNLKQLEITEALV